MRRQLRAEIRAVVRQNAWRILIFLLLYLALGGIVMVLYRWWGLPDLGAFLAGALVGLLPYFFSTFLIAQGFAPRQMGGTAEEWTAEELEALDRRRWRVFHDVPVRYGNIDHVVVGPGRVYAIETKWTSAGVRYLDQLASSAERQARRLREELSTRGAARTVVPLLVAWGPKLADELGDNPRKIGDTRVVAGRHSSVWLDRMAKAPDRLEFDLPAARAVESLIREEDAADPPS